MKRVIQKSWMITLIGFAGLFGQKPASIQYISPIHGSTLNARASQIIIRPGELLDPASAFEEDLVEVKGSKSGKVTGHIVISSDGKTLIFKPDSRFNPGEEVTVKLNEGLQTRSGQPAPSFSFTFTVTPLEEPLNPYEYIPALNPGKVLESYSATAPVSTQKIPAEDPLPDAYSFEFIHYGDPSPGYIFLTPTHVSSLDGYNLIVDNNGNVFYSEYIDSGMPVDFKVVPSGWLSYGIEKEVSPFGIAAGLTDYYIMDTTYTVVEEIQMGNGYIADFHEFQMLPNGHVLMLAYDLQPVDMSGIVPGGHPGAMVAGSIIQELDTHYPASGKGRDVIFQWRSWDHYDLTDSYQDLTQPTVNPIHLNSIEMGNDGNLIVSAIGLAEITKIDRQTGEILWRMGGKNNEFTFVNETQDYAPIYFMFQHDVRQLDNGNLTMIDNGNNDPNIGAGNVPVRPYTRALEYELDETALTATNVWQYRHDPDIFVGNFGSVQRLENGNTVIGWGAASMTGSPAMTEVDAAGDMVSELTFDRLLIASYRAYRFDWNRRRPAAYVVKYSLQKNNSYRFDNPGEETGMLFSFSDGAVLGSYNEFHVWRYENGPLAPIWNGPAPEVLPITIKTVNVNNQFPTPFTGTMGFYQNHYHFEHPESLVIYHKYEDTITPLQTVYKYWEKFPGSNDPEIDGWIVSAIIFNHGEYYVGYPDPSYAAFPPDLISPINGELVNQNLPVTLKWTPVGLVDTYHLQVAADNAFSTVVVDTNGIRNAVFEMENPSPNTAYYWRVSAAKYTDENTYVSGWSDTGTFATTAPFITVTAPNGGESWQQARSYFIQWDDVIENSVTIELYRNDAFLQLITTTESDGIYSWSIPGSTALGSDYKILVKSAADETISDMSDQDFSVIAFSDVPEDPALNVLNFELAQNYPNPFNARTRITYTIPAQTRVTLKLYDILGHEVKTLVDGVQSPNRYSVHLDAKDLPTGVYFYRLRSGDNHIVTRKLVLTK